MTNGNDIYNEIREERSRQDQKWGGAEHDDTHSPEEWAGIIHEHAERARGYRADQIGLSDYRQGKERIVVELSPLPKGECDYRKQMVRVAALAVAAIESHDRINAQEGEERA